MCNHLELALTLTLFKIRQKWLQATQVHTLLTLLHSCVHIYAGGCQYCTVPLICAHLCLWVSGNIFICSHPKTHQQLVHTIELIFAHICWWVPGNPYIYLLTLWKNPSIIISIVRCSIPHPNRRSIHPAIPLIAPQTVVYGATSIWDGVFHIIELFCAHRQWVSSNTA